MSTGLELGFGVGSVPVGTVPVPPPSDLLLGGWFPEPEGVGRLLPLLRIVDISVYLQELND